MHENVIDKPRIRRETSSRRIVSTSRLDKPRIRRETGMLMISDKKLR